MSDELTLADFTTDLECKLRKIGTAHGGKFNIWYCRTCGFNRPAAPRNEKVECAVRRALERHP